MKPSQRIRLHHALLHRQHGPIELVEPAPPGKVSRVYVTCIATIGALVSVAGIAAFIWALIPK